MFEFSLVAANLWYAVLAYDLMKAIRNPFGYVIMKLFYSCIRFVSFLTSSRPSSGWQSHTIVWGTSLGAVVLLVVSKLWKVGPG